MLTSARAEARVLERTLRLRSSQSIETISSPTLYSRPSIALNQRITLTCSQLSVANATLHK